MVSSPIAYLRWVVVPSGHYPVSIKLETTVVPLCLGWELSLSLLTTRLTSHGRLKMLNLLDIGTDRLLLLTCDEPMLSPRSLIYDCLAEIWRYVETQHS